MNDYILFMHNDGGRVEPEEWTAYTGALIAKGMLRGGSAIGGGMSVSQNGESSNITAHITGYIKIEAGDIEQVKAIVADNPVFKAGGTVEIRELPKS
jgi:hypothetical protein